MFREKRTFFGIAINDLLIAAAIAAVGFLTSYRGAYWNESEYTGIANGVWFEADSARVFHSETGQSKGNDRTAMHPLYPYVTRPGVWLIGKILNGRDVHVAVRFFHSAVAALWIGLFFLLLRRFTVRRWDAALFTAVLGTTAAAFFWLPVIETFVLGGLSMYPALALAAGSEPGNLAQHVAAGVASLGVTVTNVMASIFSSYVKLPRRKFVTAVGFAALLVIALTFVHQLAFPSRAAAPQGPSAEWSSVLAPESSGGMGVLRAFLFNSVVAPEFTFKFNFQSGQFPFLSFQASRLFSGGWASRIATVAWAGLLGFGVVALIREKSLGPLRPMITLVVLYQLLLHACYGRETFLYSAQFVPFLVAIAALATRSRQRPLVLALAALLTVTNLINSHDQYVWAKQYLHRSIPLKAMSREGKLIQTLPKRNSDDSWNFRIWKELGIGRDTGSPSSRS